MTTLMESADLPIFARDFDHAVVRLATYQRARRTPARLLFSTVTFLSSARPLPVKMIGCDMRRVEGTEGNVFFRRVAMSVDDAIQWYRSLSVNTLCKTPVPSRAEDIDEALDGIDFVVSDLTDDPVWPRLGVPMGQEMLLGSESSADPSPFIGNSPSRIHRRFGSQDGFDALLSDDEALLFLKRRLHVDLRDYPEYLGSVAMVVPDPIIEKVENFLIPARDSTAEQIFFRFVPRPGKSMSGLQLTLFERQALLLSRFETMTLPDDGILQLDRAPRVSANGYILSDPESGALINQPALHFIRSVNVNTNVVGTVTKVIVPTGDSPNSPLTRYQVSGISDTKERVIEEPQLLPPDVRVARADSQRRKAADAARYDQKWFKDGCREDAMAFIRSRIGPARKSILIADPYFGVLQIPQYLLAVQRTTVDITILTSRLAFESIHASAAADMSSRLPEEENRKGSDSLAHSDVPVQMTAQAKKRLLEFKHQLDCFQNRDSNQLVKALVLPGKNPSLHDRFLVVDDAVWFLGNSLNTLGVRASMIIKLPNPDDVLRELTSMINKAQPFEEYLAVRQSVKKMSPSASKK
ncbi:VPA1262 family N-terminal domain-containing protein [Burkholderia pyrrocinia]